MKQPEEEQNREKRFCVFMARGFSPEEAARRAGYRAGDCGWRAAALLGEARVRRRVARLARELAFRTPAELARAGLERLALGDADGAAGLLYDDGDALSPNAELFQVAEIKRPKGGGVEIKFFDRLRALSLLAGLDTGKADAAGSLLTALERSASMIGGGDDGTV